MACVKLGEQALELVPAGAVVCLGCQSYDGFVVYYQDTAVTWGFGGVDSQGRVIYQPLLVTNMWNKGLFPKEAFCTKCKSRIPLWQLKMNPNFKTS